MEWHDRFRVQANWTKDLRRYLFKKAIESDTQNILEVGCGTGVIIKDLTQTFTNSVVGIDINPEHIYYANTHNNLIDLLIGDGFHLPFTNATFNIVFCHYLLMWIYQPSLILLEMKRVVKPGGYVIALAEPDYGGRIDFPDSLINLGFLQKEALIKQGADPVIGRKLRSYFKSANIQIIESGVIGGCWGEKQDIKEFESEWQTIENDLYEYIDPDVLDQYKQKDIDSWKKSTRVLYVPTFYIIGGV